jgi:hypothetical protein
MMTVTDQLHPIQQPQRHLYFKDFFALKEIFDGMILALAKLLAYTIVIVMYRGCMDQASAESHRP